MDVSFISATLVLPAVLAAAFRGSAPGGPTREAVVLVKPQFEAGREHVGKGGIVRDPAAHALAIERVRGAITEAGGIVTGAPNQSDDGSDAVIASPILGAEGNREFLLHAIFPS